MLLPDLNVLIGAHRGDSPAHPGCRDWLRSVFAGDEPFGLCAPVLIGLVRILTHPGIFTPPDTHDEAFAFVRSLLGHPNAVVLNPGRDHLRLFEELCRAADARGDLVTDAYLPPSPSRPGPCSSATTTTSPASPACAGGVRSTDAAPPSAAMGHRAGHNGASRGGGREHRRRRRGAGAGSTGDDGAGRRPGAPATTARGGRSGGQGVVRRLTRRSTPRISMLRLPTASLNPLNPSTPHPCTRRWPGRVHGGLRLPAAVAWTIGGGLCHRVPPRSSAWYVRPLEIRTPLG